jgi:hypothetical protein
MKMQLKSMLLLFGVSFFIFAGFKNADQRSVKAQQFKDHSSRVTIELIVTNSNASGTIFTGTFTAHGGLETSGTFEMEPNFFGHFAHCSQTFTSHRGTFTAISDCEFIHNTGTWYIISGTGRYSDLQGNGKLLMTAGGLVEAWTGKVRRDNDDNDNDQHN